MLSDADGPLSSGKNGLSRARQLISTEVRDANTANALNPPFERERDLLLLTWLLYLVNTSSLLLADRVFCDAIQQTVI